MVYSGLRLLLGVSSSIAAYRALDIASTVTKGGGAVRVVLTPNAAKIAGPAAFDAITGNRTVTSLWDSAGPGDMDHLEATKWANVFCVAPATAATLARLALGLADDALSTYAIAWSGPLVIAPAMNPTMYQHPTVQGHVHVLATRGCTIVGPGHGVTACGDTGIGRLADVDDILIAIVDRLRRHGGIEGVSGRRILITSGPTREFADPVRCITNPSTGRMGVALARQSLSAGAGTMLVSGPCDLAMPPGLESLDRVTTADEMKDAVLRRLPEADIVVFAAAVSDWKPAERSAAKVRKEDSPEESTLRLIRTPDVALEASKHRRAEHFFVGFAAESHDMEGNARSKMHRKSFDMIVANPVNEEGAGFASETNRASLIWKDGRREIPSMSKDALAREILLQIATLLKS